MKNRNYVNIPTVIAVGKEDQLLQREKDDVKLTLMTIDKMRRYCEYLSKDPSTWPTKAQTDEKLKASRKERRAVKDALEEETDKLSELFQTINTDYEQLKGKIQILEEKLKLFEDKKAQFEARRKLDPQAAKAAIDKCSHAIEALEGELYKQKAEIVRLDQSLDELRSEVKSKKVRSSSPFGEELVIRARKVLGLLELLSNVKVTEVFDNKIQLEFGHHGESRHADDGDDLSLLVTMTIQMGCHDDLILKDVKVSIEHFNIKPVLDVAIATNDIPYLVRSIHDAWHRHFPLLSEIDNLNKHHAVDWIQNQSRLRVLVGKCGKIMFTLHVPKDYPTAGGVTLLDSYGIDGVTQTDLPDSNATLQEWVLYLENKYGQTG